MVVFIVAPKNSGLQKYREIALSYLSNINAAKILEVRGEDVPFWVNKLSEKEKMVIGLTGEDLYKEYCLNNKRQLRIIKRIIWDDPKAKFRKPTLCLIGAKNSTIKKQNITVCISSKYKLIGDKFLKRFERKGFVIRKIYVNGCVELSCSEGIADMIIDIVYTGSSLQKYNLKIIDRIMGSDFLIIGSRR